jgi:hypothetical protein
MGKISDIWVRLGLKKEGFDKGMNDAAKKTEQTGGKMSKMLTAAKAGWAAVGAAVIAFANEMVKATNKVGDAWARTMGGVKNGWQTMLANLSNMDWKDVLKGMNVITSYGFFKKLFKGTDEAAAAGRDMTAAFDAEFELTRSLAIQREKIKGELADLRVALANVNLSPEERRAAGARYKALLAPLYEAEIETRKEMLAAAVKAWLAGTGVTATTEQVKDFFTYIGTDAERMAKVYPELARVYNDLKGDKANDVLFTAIANLTAAENGLANELKEVNTTLNGIKDLSIVPDLSADTDLDIDLTDIDTIEPMDWDTILGDYDTELDAFVEKWKATQEEIAMLNGMLEGAIVASMSNGLQAITDMMAGIEGANAGAVLGALMQPFADTAIQLGEMLIAQGLGVEAFKKSLESLNGVAAIAAGAALVALGSAMRSGISALAKGGGAASTASYSGGGASYGNVQNYESEMTIYVEGRISGNDIVLSGNKTLNKWRR